MSYGYEIIHPHGLQYPPHNAGSVDSINVSRGESKKSYPSRREVPFRKVTLPQNGDNRNGKGLTSEEIELWKNFREVEDPDEKKEIRKTLIV